MTDPQPITGDDLDDLAASCFGTDSCRERLLPLLERWDERVGAPSAEDDHRDLLHAIRVDWALLDAPISGGKGPGDRWVHRVVLGRVPEVEQHQRYAQAAHTYAGLFEVWPGAHPWLRDRLRGLCLPLRDPVHLEAPDNAGPAALWELRIWMGDGYAHLCRPPLPYPLSIIPMLEGLAAKRFAAGGRPASLMRLRRAWLMWQRNPRAEPAPLFARLMR